MTPFRKALLPPAIVFLAAVLTACASPHAPLPARQSQAIELNNQGLDYFRRNDYAQALALFQQALQLEQAIEHEDGIALNRLNLSLVYQRMGRMAEAEQALDAILLDRKLAYSNARRSEAALRKALLATQRNDRETAVQWLDQASEFCGRDCILAGKVLNLRARLALDARHAEEALSIAGIALAANRHASDRDEIANSLRLQASAHLVLHAGGVALPLLNEALAIDKALGASDKIYQDLLLLGHASGGDPDAMKDYWLRAQTVAQAAGNRPEQAEIDKLLAELAANANR